MRRYSIGVFLNVLDRNIDNWKKQVKYIEDLGRVEHVEILLEDVLLNDKEKFFLKNLLKKYHIIIHAPFMDLTILSPHKEIVKTSLSLFRKAIDIGKYLSAEVMTIHAEKYPNFWTENQAQTQTIFWTKLLARQSSFPIAVENLSLGGKTQIPYPATTKQIVQLAQALSDKTALTIDTGHLLKDRFDVYDVLKKTKDRVKNIHLHDGKQGSAHLRLGDGNLNLSKFLSLLEDLQYQWFVTLEVVGEKEILDSWRILKETVK